MLTTNTLFATVGITLTLICSTRQHFNSAIHCSLIDWCIWDDIDRSFRRIQRKDMTRPVTRLTKGEAVILTV